MNVQEKKTIEFFDRISGTYADKYASTNTFHRYFFNQRLEEATGTLKGNAPIVLDIGTGTGNLYDYLSLQIPGLEFYGTDLSGEMIRQSRIPITHQYVGKCYELDLPVEKFDYIFMLGVTTYMTKQELQQTLQFISERLDAGGQAIISFTNKFALDNVTRTILKKPAQWLRPAHSVMGQSFRIHTYDRSEAKQLFSDNFELIDIRYLNHTVFPFNLLMPVLSVKLARFWHRKLPEGMLSWLSSDYLMVVKPKS